MKHFYELTIQRKPFEFESDIQIDFNTLYEAQAFANKIIFQNSDIYEIVIYEIDKDGNIIKEY